VVQQPTQLNDVKITCYEKSLYTINRAFDFKLHNVIIFVKDEADNPVKGAFIKAFSVDWGIMYPHYEEWGITDNDGLYKFVLPTGNWIFIASSGWDYAIMNPNKGVFVETANIINNDTIMVLKPRKNLIVKITNEKGSLLPVDELYVLSSRYIPAIPPAFIGYSTTGIFTLYTNLEDQNLTLITIKRSSTISDGYFLVKEITPTQTTNTITPINASKLTMYAYEPDGSLSKYWDIGFRLPELYLGNWFFYFPITGKSVLHITPIKAVLNARYIPPGWYYYFESIALSLEANREYTYSFGGKGFFRLWVIRQNTQLWFDIRDMFGNVLAFYSDSRGGRNITIRIFEGGKEVFKDNIGKYIPGTLIYSIKKTFGELTTFELHIDVGPLGGLGKVSISGLLYDEKHLVKFKEVQSKNFVIHMPVEYFWNISGQVRDLVFIDSLETVYKSMGIYLEEDLQNKPHRVEVNFDWAGAAGVGGTSFVGFGVGVARWPTHIHHGYLGVLSHELGHMYSRTPPLIYYVDCPLYCEPQATYLGIEALAYLYGSNYRLWFWGTHPGFFDYIKGDETVPAIERAQFIFFYLHKVYGPEIHKDFFQLWANNTVLKNKLMVRGFGVNETMITLYSYLARENLASLFQIAGYNVSEERVNEGLKLILIENPCYIVHGVKYLGHDGVPGPILILDNQAVPIVSGDRNTTPIPSIVTVAREFGRGRVVASLGGFFTDKILLLFDNKMFARNIIEWLSKLEKGDVLISQGHREWYFGPGFNEFRKMLEELGYNVTLYYGSLTSEILSNYDVLLIGTAWGKFTKEEVSAIVNFVYNGGGLLLTGLGWSWPGITLDDYPMNIIGEHFGIRWIDAYTEDKDPEHNYKGAPIFHVFYPNIEIGSIPQAMEFINNALEQYSSNLPSILEVDPDLRWKFFSANELLILATTNLALNSSKRLEIYNFYKDVFSSYPQLFKRNTIYDKNTQSAMAWIRERSYFAYITSILLYSEGLTSQKIVEIADVLGLTNRYRDIWIDYQVLILDNGMSSKKQLDFIYNYFSLLPRELYNLKFISIRDLIGKPPADIPDLITLFSGQSRLTQKWGAVNIFGIDVGGMRENGFPDDVEPYDPDVFSIVVAHEVNHNVDWYYVSRNTTLSERKKVLIERAGCEHMNYLRSMLPDCFFVQAPQEFFASIANQWFANTTHTLKLALVRFDKGYKEPLNQFLFFADVYSRGGKTTLFYTTDVEGNIKRKEVIVLRDKEGRIVGLVDGKTVYRFTLDLEGYVTSYTISIDITSPTTTHSYDGLWYSSDITIILSSSDNLSGVAEIFYRINNGPIMNVSVKGQPVITTEGANNTLEYWGVDNAGNEEPHKILTGIKLDKTPPIVKITGIQIQDSEFVISWFGSDTLSGIDYYEICLDKGECINVGINTSYAFKNLTPREYIIKAVDTAGNINITMTTITVTTQTITLTTTITTTITTTQTNWTIITILVPILLLIGALIGYMVKKSNLSNLVR